MPINIICFEVVMKVNNNSEEKLLRVTFDDDFSCITQVKNMCQKASKKLDALYRVCRYITLNQRRTIMKAFIESQFGYCPLVWIFHANRTLNNTMNNIQERALRLGYLLINVSKKKGLIEFIIEICKD